MQKIDTWVPFSTIVHFIFSVGWLKVAQDLSMPFGDDDNDTDMCQFLAVFAEVLFTVADYGPRNRPSQLGVKTAAPKTSACSFIKAAFDQNVLRYEPTGQKIVAKLKRLAKTTSRGGMFFSRANNNNSMGQSSPQPPQDIPNEVYVNKTKFWNELNLIEEGVKYIVFLFL